MAITPKEESHLVARLALEKAERLLVMKQQEKRAAQEQASVDYQATLAATNAMYDPEIATLQSAVDAARVALELELDK